ncbi:unnamed protein product, partial [Mesorhabditis belari]|uniref:Anaphase-promoting complex subunit 4-like WD40 domain-containing protein n=1 Tax=Mesorhabditis belari TaxID=2138241 RepID=A0AAF3ELU3_9BILA
MVRIQVTSPCRPRGRKTIVRTKKVMKSIGRREMETNRSELTEAAAKNEKLERELKHVNDKVLRFQSMMSAKGVIKWLEEEKRNDAIRKMPLDVKDGARHDRWKWIFDNDSKYEVYLWNPDTGEVGLLAEANEDTDLITAIKWAVDGRCFAVGGDTERVKLYDPTKNKKLRKLDAECVSRATCMVWKDHILWIGYKSGQVIPHDVRIRNSVVGVLDGDSQLVCGIHWSIDGSQLATGGGANLVNIWDAQLVNTLTRFFFE